MFWLTGYPIEEFVFGCFINCYFLAGSLGPIYKRNSVEFLIDFWELEYLEIVPNRLGKGSRFSNVYDIIMPCEFLVGFRETGTHSRTRHSFYVSTIGSRRDNFIGIRAIDFLNPHSIFTSLVDIGCLLVICLSCIWI